jgi:hypothetical protein
MQVTSFDAASGRYSVAFTAEAAGALHTQATVRSAAGGLVQLEGSPLLSTVTGMPITAAACAVTGPGLQVPPLLKSLLHFNFNGPF